MAGAHAAAPALPIPTIEPDTLAMDSVGEVRRSSTYRGLLMTSAQCPGHAAMVVAGLLAMPLGESAGALCSQRQSWALPNQKSALAASADSAVGMWGVACPADARSPPPGYAAAIGNSFGIAPHNARSGAGHQHRRAVSANLSARSVRRAQRRTRQTVNAEVGRTQSGGAHQSGSCSDA